MFRIFACRKETLMSTKHLDYQKLLARLVKDFSWPTDYMFKFIVPFNVDSLNKIKALFAENARVSHRESSGGKYISVTAVQHMDNPDDVIEIYKKAEFIDKIIAL
jgi:putative lipoic acid-binding regulatory protein